MPFKSFIRSSYGESTVRAVTTYTEVLEKQANFRNHVVFNARCKNSGVIPPSLRIKSPIDTTRGHEIAERASRQFLNERLRLANYKLRKLEEERKWREIGLRRTPTDTDFEQARKMSEERAECVFLDRREKQKKKFERFQQRVTSNTSAAPKEKNWVVNLSQHRPTPGEMKLLERGMNFATCPKAVPKTDIVVGVESALRQSGVDSQTAERARATIAGILKKAKPPNTNIDKEEQEALRSLRENKEITILPADKGNATVILDTEAYHEKAMSILGKHPFKLLTKDPTAANERRVNDTLKRLKSKGKLDEKTVNNLRVPQNGTRPPMFYGCVKMHKQGAPLRPIVSAVGSATYKLAKFVNKLLSPYLIEVESYVKNTSDFVEQLESLSVASDELLVSFDVKSLFTSVPVPAALDAVREIVEEDADFATKNGIESGTAMELLRVCFKLAITSLPMALPWDRRSRLWSQTCSWLSLKNAP